MWAKVDDMWWHSLPVLDVSLEARGLLISCLSWAAGFPEEDLVPLQLIRMVGFGRTDAVELAEELAGAGAWTWMSLDGAKGYLPNAEFGIPRKADDGRLRGAVDEIGLLYRDGWACAHCGATCAALQVDHVTPWSSGGSDDLHNLQWLCPPCNGSKGKRHMDDWVKSSLGQRSLAGDCARAVCGHTTSARLARLELAALNEEVA